MHLACQNGLSAYNVSGKRARDDSGHSLKPFEARNAYFDALLSTPGLKWLGQNTNHMPATPP